jgi:hypothetical protein
MGDHQEPSVLAGLQPFEWNSQQAVRYEVAVEAITQAVAAYTALIHQATDGGELAEAARLAEQRTACSQAREQLRAADPDAVDQAVRTYRQLAERLRAEIR